VTVLYHSLSFGSRMCFTTKSYADLAMSSALGEPGAA
jgi:hypothetical protein